MHALHGMRIRKIGIVIGLAAGVTAQAQWLVRPTPGTPRTRDGKADLRAKAPRGRDGKPDLSGIWEADAAPFQELLKYQFADGINGLGEDDPSRYFFNILADFKPGEEPLIRSAAAAPAKRGLAQGSSSLCAVPSLPVWETSPSPHKIVQTPGALLILYEAETAFRQVYLDGRELPKDPQPTFLGYSVGHWEGDTLVVEAAGFNDRGALDALGHRHSDAVRLTERFHRRDFGHMEVSLTMDDPKTFTKPVTVNFMQHLLPDTDLIEYFCAENETDAKHVIGH